MATKIDIEDMKFDKVAYSKQHNIIQIIKYLTGTIATTINSNADNVDELASILADVAQLVSQLYEFLVSLMDTVGGLLGDMREILELIAELKESINDQQSQIESIQHQVTRNENLLYNIAYMRKDFMDNFPLGSFLKSLGGTSTD